MPLGRSGRFSTVDIAVRCTAFRSRSKTIWRCAGIGTTAGSKVLADWVPDFDATTVQRLKDAGAIVLGKTNIHEWALGGTTINPFYGAPRNPWNTGYIAGGSSGGSAAAVAADLCLASIGTDSAQIGAQSCLHVRHRRTQTTYGRVSQYGTVAGTGAY